MKYLSIILFLIYTNAHGAEPEPCSTGSFLRSLFTETTPEELQASRSKLLRVSESKLVDEALADHSSVYHDLYEVVGKYDKKNGEKIINIGDKEFTFNSSINAEDDKLVFTIHSLNIGEMEYGKNPKGVNKAFFKFIGTLLRSIDRNVTSVPNGFKSVQVVGSTVVNKRLEEALQNFGFEVSKKTKLDAIIATSKGGTGYAKALIVKGGTTASLVKKQASANPTKVFTMIPYLTSSTKKMLSAGNFINGKGAGKTWILEIPLQPVQP